MHDHVTQLTTSAAAEVGLDYTHAHISGTTTFSFSVEELDGVCGASQIAALGDAMASMGARLISQSRKRARKCQCGGRKPHEEIRGK